MVTTTPRTPVARNVVRVLGVALVVGGVVLAFTGGKEIGAAASDDFAVDPGFGAFASLAGGLFLIVFGLGALNAGFLGAQARYVSGETAPAVREFGSAFRGDPESDGPEEDAPEQTGRFCSECGVRNDDGARFCDACGHALAEG